MSKKILKRSLALGALMAFVITGSAMAAEVYKLNDNVDVKENYTHGIQNEGVWEPYLHCDLNGFKLTFENGFTDHGHESCNPDAYNGFWFTDSDDGKQSQLIAKASGTDIRAIYGVGDINVDYVSAFNENGQAIYVHDSKGIRIFANNIDITAKNDNVIQVNTEGNLTLGKYDSTNNKFERVDSVTIDAKGGLCPIRLANTDSYVRIYANQLNIYKTQKEDVADKYKGVRVTDGAELTIDAESGLIDTGFMVEDNNTSVVLTLGKDATLKGNFEVTGGAAATLDLSGTWELSDAVNKNGVDNDNSLTNATFRNGSTFVIDGATYENNDGKNVSYALNGVGKDAVLKVEDEAQIKVTNIKNATYNIATGFKTIEANNYWNVLDLTNVMQATWDKAENNDLKLVISAKGADAMEDSVAPEGSGEMVSEIITEIGNVENISELPEETQAAAKFIQDAVVGNDDVTAKNIISNALQMAEAGGNSGTAVTVANNVSSVTTGRMGFSATPSAQKGGNGVGLLAEDSGAAIWAQYVHGKDSVEDMPMSGGATSYEGQFNGVVMGVDFKKVGKFQSGVAFNYGEGDTNSVGNRISTRSDYDFWGVGYYGNIRNDDTNFIFDVNYAKSESDVEQDNGGTTLEASPETTTWSAGVKVEKLYQNNNVQIVPYTGLRFMSVDTDSYKATNGTDTLFNYAPERQDIWLLPLGVSIKQEVTNANGWTVTPKVDLSYIWAFGDTDSEMTVAIPGVSSTSRLGYTVMDDESWLGVVGLEAAKGDWTFGVSYSYQKGDHSENEKWYVDAKYSF